MADKCTAIEAANYLIYLMNDSFGVEDEEPVKIPIGQTIKSSHP